MASIGSWLWGTSQLDEAVDKATSELIPNGSEDVALNLEICDQIRSKSTPAKDAMRALKRRLNHKNPNVQRLALGLTDICVKNGGDHFLTEMSSREFMDNLVSILKIPGLNHSVKNDILKYIQNWSLAFEGKPNLSYVGQAHKTLKGEGYHFPPVDFALANSAMVDTSTAPEWIDSDVCLRCRTPFTFTNRKHHCRNCGQVFDQQCSSKSIPLPHFGITQAVRVCDGCYNKLQKKAEYSNKEHRHSASVYTHRSPRDFVDPDLQRAIESSLEEVGTARRPGYVPAQPSTYNWQASEPPLVDRKTHPDRNIPVADDDDPDLRAAIEASLREASAPKPSAPMELSSTDSYNNVYTTSQSYPPAVVPAPAVPKPASYDLQPMEADAILTFGQTMEQVQAQGVRDMSRHPAVNDLFDKANGLRPKLVMSLDDTDSKAQALSQMNDKLSQVVKLYDKLLTEQVSRRLRSPQQAHFATVPVRQSTQTPTNGYGQWAPSHQPASSAPSTVFVPQRTDSAQYAPPLISRHSLSTVSELEPQAQYAHYTAGPSKPYASEVPGSSRHSTTPLTSPPAHPQLQQTSQFTIPPLSVSYVSQPTTASATYMGHQPVSIPEFATAPTTSSQPVPTPTLPPVVQLPATHTPTLTQQHNVTARAATNLPSAPFTPSSTMTRTSHSQYLPQFPSAPTTVPQPFELFAPSPPTTIPERREELLIDL